METLYVQPGGPRPDFRLLITSLWRDGQDCDTDGDARSPASREWTELTCRNRQDRDERFEVVPVREAPLTLEVRSEQAELAARVAYFLALETHGSWSAHVDGPPREPQELERALGDGFPLAAARRRARYSVWRREGVTRQSVPEARPIRLTADGRGPRLANLTCPSRRRVSSKGLVSPAIRALTRP